MPSVNPGPSSSATLNDPLATQGQVATSIVAATPTRGSVQSTSVFKNRIALIGDSIALFSLFSTNLPTTVGTFVVKNGIATLTLSANTQVMTGSYFGLGNIGDPGMGHPDNGRMIQAISASSATTATNIITFATTALNGDYSNPYGSGNWIVVTPASTADTGLAQWLNNVLRGQFLITCSYAYVGETSAQVVNTLPKIIAGPPFDYALVACGINDIRASTVTNQATAMAAANAAFVNLTTLVTTLQATGAKVILCTVPPNNNAAAGGANQQAVNLACSQLRQMILKLARANNQIIIMDQFKEGIAGQVSAAAGTYFLSTMTADGTHPNANCQMFTALNEANGIVVPPFEISQVTILDDIFNFTQANANFANYQQNSGLPGTTGTLAGGATGSAATLCTLTNVGATTVGTGNFTPTQIGTTNSQNYGFAQRIQCTTSAANQGWTLNFGAGIVPPAGTWFQVGVRVYARSATTGLGALFGTFGIGPTNYSFNGNGGFDTGYQLPSGQVVELTSGPLFFAIQPSFARIILNLLSVGSGSSDLEVSAPFIRPIDNPYV